MASRLPGIWRGTLKIPPRAAGEAETASPALLRFDVSAGYLRWNLAAGATAPGTGGGRHRDRRGWRAAHDGHRAHDGHAAAERRAVALEHHGGYAGTMVGDRLEVSGITTDKQVHVLSIRRVVE